MFLHNYTKYVPLLGSSIILLFIFFYQLDYTALNSYDEAWYGDVSRSILLQKNIGAMQFNHEPFFDQPPIGILLMSLAGLLFGSNEFSVRFASAFLGAGTILLIYFLGKKLASKTTGFVAALVLLSSMWFVFRARSGNIDITFIFFEVTTLLLLLQRTTKTFYASIACFGLLILTKTLIGFGLLPVIFYILFTQRKDMSFKKLLLGSLLWSAIVLPWYMYNFLTYPNFFERHFIEIAQRGGENSYSLQSLQNSFYYVAIGIGKWYKIFILSVPTLFFAYFLHKKVKKEVMLLATWFLGFGILFISSETQIWHLLPVYPIAALAIGLAVQTGVTLLQQKIPSMANVAQFLSLVFILSLSVYQFKQFSNLFYYKERVYSAERDISQKARGIDLIYLAEAFYPAAVYYSEAKVYYALINQDTYELTKKSFLAQDGKVFIINANLFHKLQENNISFDVIDNNEQYYLVSK